MVAKPKRLTDAQVQKKLDQLTKISNELAAEAKARRPGQGVVFYESGGTFHLMSEDNDGGIFERQENIVLSSKGHCLLDCGSW